MKISLRDLNSEEIEEYFFKNDIPRYRANQVYGWLNKGIEDFLEMRNLPKNILIFLMQNFYIKNIEIVKVFKSNIDETYKYLLKLNDGNIIECVLMKNEDYNTICISSQVGCRMGCSFCASGVGGLVRNLTAGEMIGQYLLVKKNLGISISNIVLMGSGEPLDNYDNVIKFLRLINDKKGLNISMRNITLSTCGIIPKIKELMKLKLQLTLAVSLHNPNNKKRSEIMPINNTFKINDLMKTLKEYANYTKRRVTIEYALIDNVNDSKEDANKLVNLVRGINCHVNLIQVNENKENSYKKSNNIYIFRDILIKNNISTTFRRSRGSDIDGACGQLRNNYLNISN